MRDGLEVRLPECMELPQGNKGTFSWQQVVKELQELEQRVMLGKSDRRDNRGQRCRGEGDGWLLPWVGQGLCVKGRVAHSPGFASHTATSRFLQKLCDSSHRHGARPECGCVPVSLMYGR